MKKFYIFILFLSIIVLTGCSGKSAYDLAVDNGFNGTIEEYLESLKGKDAQDITIQDIFESLVELGYYDENQYQQFLNDYLNDYLKEQNDEEVIRNNTLKSSVSIKTGFSSSATATTYYAGSGVIYKIDGDYAYIITNHHVLYSNGSISTNIKVYLYGMEYSEQAYTASYVGCMQSYDIAVIKIKLDSSAQNYEAAKICTSRSYVGDDVFAIGNPLGYGLSITSGILSVDSEYIDTESYDNVRVMRIDASVNGGNSGGGLFNKYGELIGIIDAKIVDEAVEGIAYAIPISSAYAIAENIIYNQSDVNKVILGITTGIGSSSMSFDEDALKYYIREKVIIDVVSLNTVASFSGLKAGDEIVSMTYNNISYTIERNYTLSDLLFLVKFGDTISIEICRNGQLMDIDVTF